MRSKWTLGAVTEALKTINADNARRGSAIANDLKWSFPKKNRLHNTDKATQTRSPPPLPTLSRTGRNRDITGTPATFLMVRCRSVRTIRWSRGSRRQFPPASVTSQMTMPAGGSGAASMSDTSAASFTVGQCVATFTQLLCFPIDGAFCLRFTQSGWNFLGHRMQRSACLGIFLLRK
jgi:hypothetical protein